MPCIDVENSLKTSLVVRSLLFVLYGENFTVINLNVLPHNIPENEMVYLVLWCVGNYGVLKFFLI